MTDDVPYDRPVPWSNEGGLNPEARRGVHRFWYKLLSRKFDIDSGIETVRFLIRRRADITAVVEQMNDAAKVPSLLVNLRKWSNNDLSREIVKWAVRAVDDPETGGALEVILQFEPHWWYGTLRVRDEQGEARDHAHVCPLEQGQCRVVQTAVPDGRGIALVSERSVGGVPTPVG